MGISLLVCLLIAPCPAIETRPGEGIDARPQYTPDAGLTGKKDEFVVFHVEHKSPAEMRRAAGKKTQQAP